MKLYYRRKYIYIYIRIYDEYDVDLALKNPAFRRVATEMKTLENSLEKIGRWIDVVPRSFSPP